MATRKLVTGRYINRSTYVLFSEDGTEFKTIREGEAFKIGNQIRPWYPVRVAKKNGKGTILMCQKFGSNGNVIEEFPLIHGKHGLWALTSGAARKGVFHNYHAPSSELESQLDKIGVSRKIIEKVDNIDIELEVGGQLCHHCTNKWGYGCITDGKEEDITEPNRAPDDHPNQYHRGCEISTYIERIYNATYIIYYSIHTTMNGSMRENVEKVILTKEADESEVVKELKRFE